MRHFLSRVRDSVRRIVKDLTHRPQTYDASREELGGVAFRPITQGQTERWFIPSSGTTGKQQRIDDSTALVIPRPPIFGRHARWILPAVGGVAVLTVVVGASARGAAGPAAAVAAPVLVAAAPPKAAHAPVVPSLPPVGVAKPRPIRDAKPARAKGPSNMSPSVHALFEGRANGKQKRGRR